MEELISVVVPVYNIEKYIDRCVESIVTQDYKNLQIILVNDGSIDSSGKICDEWKKKDSRIEVIHKTNGGLVSARKAGIKIAKGYFVCPVDGDDWIEYNMISSLYNMMKKYECDMVSTLPIGAENYISKDDYLEGKYYTGKNAESFYQKLIFINQNELTNMLPGCIWGKMYITEKMKEMQLDVDDAITYGEDGACVWHYILNSSSIYVSRQAYYHYIKREDSISGSVDKYEWSKYNYFYEYVKSYFKSTIYSDILMKQLNEYIVKYRFEPSFLRQTHLKKFPLYMLPYEIIPKKSDIILYGAGAVGMSYYLQLKNSDYCNIVAWIDKEKKKDTITIECVKNLEFDYILVAILNQNVKDEICRDLVKLDIKQSKILWVKPKIINEFYQYIYEA